MRNTVNLGLSLYDSSDKMNITGESESLNHNMEIIDDELGKRTLNYSMKMALNNLFRCVAYDGDSDYAEAYNNFKVAFGINVQLLSISAIFNGETAPVGIDASDLDITVIGHFSEGGSSVLTGWTINGIVEAGNNMFTIAFGELTTTVSVIGDPEYIPSGYTRCSYINSNGTQHIILDNIKMIAGTDKFVVDFELNSDAKNDSMLFGGFAKGSINRVGLNWTNGYLYYSMNDNWIRDTKGFELSTNNRTVAVLDTYNGTVQLGETTIEAVKGSYTSSRLCIFGYMCHNESNNIINKISMKLHRFTIYRKDILLADFVPCLRNSDDIAGLYDLVTGVFYKSDKGLFGYEVA